MSAPIRRDLLTAEEAEAFAAALHADGLRLVFTNGVFDILHPGHVRYLREARRAGDALLVGLNTDRSVRAIKGPSRPINPEQERAELLLALAVVDAVVLFDEDTPEAIIRRVLPDVLVKGADWAPSAIVGREFVEARGGRVLRARFADGFSSTALIAKVLGEASRY